MKVGDIYIPANSDEKNNVTFQIVKITGRTITAKVLKATKTSVIVGGEFLFYIPGHEDWLSNYKVLKSKNYITTNPKNILKRRK